MEQSSVYVEGAHTMEQRTETLTPSGAPSVSGRGPSGGDAGRPQAGLKENKEAMPTVSEREVKARVDEILNRWPAVGLAVGVVRNGRLEFFCGHGVADIASKTPITEDTVFRIASITKTFTAIAVMQLWEQGLVDLDAPANDYLRAYKLIPAKASFRPTTVRHLLTHTGGVPEQAHPSQMFRTDYGQSVKLGRPVPSLAEYYGGGLRVAVEPGTSFMYGDHSFATLGQIVEDVSDQPLHRYFRDHIFDPLGMADTDLLRSERVQARLATGYKLTARAPQALTDRELITKAAGAIYSTTRDMARYVAALLGGGRNEHGSVLTPATLTTMFEPHYQPDPRITGIATSTAPCSLRPPQDSGDRGKPGAGIIATGLVQTTSPPAMIDVRAQRWSLNLREGLS